MISKINHIFDIATLQAGEEHKIIACFYSEELTIEIHAIVFENGITGELTTLYIYFRNEEIICCSISFNDMIHTFKMDLNGVKE